MKPRFLSAGVMAIDESFWISLMDFKRAFALGCMFLRWHDSALTAFSRFFLADDKYCSRDSGPRGALRVHFGRVKRWMSALSRSKLNSALDWSSTSCCWTASESRKAR